LENYVDAIANRDVWRHGFDRSLERRSVDAASIGTIRKLRKREARRAVARRAAFRMDA